MMLRPRCGEMLNDRSPFGPGVLGAICLVFWLYCMAMTKIDLDKEPRASSASYGTQSGFTMKNPIPRGKMGAGPRETKFVHAPLALAYADNSLFLCGSAFLFVWAMALSKSDYDVRLRALIIGSIPIGLFFIASTGWQLVVWFSN